MNRITAIIYFFILLAYASIAGAWEMVPIVPDIKPQDESKLITMSICEGAPFGKSHRFKKGDATILELLEEDVKNIKVHYHSKDWQGFDNAQEGLLNMLNRKPTGVYSYPAWSEVTLLNRRGISATIEYADGVEGKLEVGSGKYICFQDKKGNYWWSRLAIQEELSETGPETVCKDDSDCWCASFTGAEFVPGKTPSRCCKEEGWACPQVNRCAQCYYE